MFIIIVKTYFYSSTKGSALKDEYGNIKPFESKEEAVSFLVENYGKMNQISKSTYQKQGMYELSHNEYSRPCYMIKKHK